MRVRLSYPAECSRQVRAGLKKAAAGVKPEREEKEEESMSVVLLVDPGRYRELDEMLRDETKGRGKMEVVDLREVVESEQQL